MSERSKVVIAIVGGGIGGICAAIGLGRIGYDVHIFEQAPQFSEIGAGVGVGGNGVRTLHAMGLGEDYEKIADMSEPYAPWFTFLTWDKGDVVTSVPMHGRRGNVHRARFLDCLLQHMPSNVTTHFSTRVTEVRNVDDGNGTPSRACLSIMTANSTSTEWFEASAVIGCDGVKSVVRDSFHSEMGGRILYSGSYAYRGLVDMKKAVEQTGEIMRQPAMWMGKDKHAVLFPIDHGKVLNIVTFVTDRSVDVNERVWEGPWVKPASHEQMDRDFRGWDPRLRIALSLIDKPEVWALHDLSILDRWTVGRVTLLGDSAHASMPHNGAGAGQAIEDAYVLAKLFEHPACNAETIPDFLQAYEDVRRPRASYQQIHCRESGDIYEFASPLGDDLTKIDFHLRDRYSWIWDHNLDHDVEYALSSLRKKGVIVT
ncbi:FAD/NAD(P)-binding domain-containing protein [Punctularia strigosozonata HHB-11173 SS5]|uniref:FAD/NAD(P)-binding domain-containing protein n=1 Tax=Punctularia strigosozonata (strain HHB-11173) TaxID=741275 RepID=R7S131_PUNST|nr:FAD/NAD(P)-binding domain-containing protein [Punctularia strigosozonata HHB-11173 SS5]EIN03928.1 FAD/NAD(P)-binding domain-containing protein [Punctularia strigosozonata HHB-11173 SS5]